MELNNNSPNDQYNLVGTLENEALLRKQRLEKLKSNKELPSNCHAEPNINLPRPKFRSYNPTDDVLKENKILGIKPEKIDGQIQNELDSLEMSKVVNEVDLLNLAPRKVDWDLKRNIENSLKKLEKRTEKAISELIHERIKNDHRDKI